jgi:hypothetical protein
LAYENKSKHAEVEWTLNENLDPVAGIDEAIQVTSPDELEELQFKQPTTIFRVSFFPFTFGTRTPPLLPE